MAEPNDPKNSVTLDDLSNAPLSPDEMRRTAPVDEPDTHSAAELEAVFDVPVTVQAVLGKTALEVSQLLKLAPGAIVELDRRVGEAIDIYVNNRLVARGEVVLVDEHLGVTMTEIIKTDRT
ncbi:flagellar motor switch protein FliN [Pedomonas mirosovicensis]|uniref:flagellar motor switch protein FliN n=1 Tax=Pedomonas mirosovicensis TaxID=2908641 RepID=UPI0021697B7F|nr:flagellar motor switch protein FliN [Pedomonas mirosovicensis]MCH8685888.1 flagellar motor switch protein FliN [Pedomonas mirosovicensis]